MGGHCPRGALGRVQVSALHPLSGRICCSRCWGLAGGEQAGKGSKLMVPGPETRGFRGGGTVVYNPGGLTPAGSVPRRKVRAWVGSGRDLRTCAEREAPSTAAGCASWQVCVQAPCMCPTCCPRLLLGQQRGGVLGFLHPRLLPSVHYVAVTGSC